METLRAHYDTIVKKMQETEKTLEDHKQTQKGKGFIDTKGIGKPKTFSGKTADWQKWLFSFRPWFGCAFEKGKEAMEWAQSQQDEISQEEVSLQSIEEVIDASLYIVLTQLCEGDSIDFVKAAGEGCGLEAWRRLYTNYNPVTKGRLRSTYNNIAKPKQVKDLKNLMAYILKWEDTIKKFQDESKKVIPEFILESTLVEICPDKLQDHLRLNAQQ